MRPDVRPSPLLEPGMHMVGVAPRGMRGAPSDALAKRGSQGVLRQGGAVAWSCRCKCADIGRES